MSNELEHILASSSAVAAKRLLGWVLCRKLDSQVIKLRIVETEAYHQDDPASHSFRGVTKRTAPMFEAGGSLYVYFTYGMHYCLNIVTGSAGRGEAVLLRAAEPIEGTEIMQAMRKVENIKNLANGPAKLTLALGIKSTALSGRKLNKTSNDSHDLWIEAPQQKIKDKDIIVAKRIGIRLAVDELARFYIKDNPFVSRL